MRNARSCRDQVWLHWFRVCRRASPATQSNGGRGIATSVRICWAKSPINRAGPGRNRCASGHGERAKRSSRRSRYRSKACLLACWLVSVWRSWCGCGTVRPMNQVLVASPWRATQLADSPNLKPRQWGRMTSVAREVAFRHPQTAAALICVAHLHRFLSIHGESTMMYNPSCVKSLT